MLLRGSILRKCIGSEDWFNISAESGIPRGASNAFYESILADRCMPLMKSQRVHGDIIIWRDFKCQDGRSPGNGAIGAEALIVTLLPLVWR